MITLPLIISVSAYGLFWSKVWKKVEAELHPTLVAILNIVIITINISLIFALLYLQVNVDWFKLNSSVPIIFMFIQPIMLWTVSLSLCILFLFCNSYKAWKKSTKYFNK